MDTLVYEFRPWVFAAIGFVALFYSGDSKIMYGSSLTLLWCAAMILQARMRHRSGIRYIGKR